MKRVLILALVLLFVGLVAFADNMPPAPKWSLWAEGDLYTISNQGNWGWGPSWAHMQNEVGGWYTTLGVNYDGKDYGYMAQLEFGQDLLAAITIPTQYTLSSGAIPAYLFRQFDAYYKLFDGAIKVTGGKIFDGEYNIESFIEGDNTTYWMGTSVFETFGTKGIGGTPSHDAIWVGDFGSMIQFYPMSGFNFGVGVAVPATATMGYYGSGTSAFWIDNIAAAAQYTMPNLVTINAFIRGNGGIVDANVAYLGMKNLTANAGIEIATSVGENTLGEYYSWVSSLGYTMAPLTVGIEFDGTALMNQMTGTDWAVEAMVEYVIYNNISVGAKVGYEHEDPVNGINGWLTGNVEGLEIYPYFVAKFDNGSSLSVGFQWSSGGGTGEAGNVYGPFATDSFWGIPVKFTVAF